MKKREGFESGRGGVYADVPGRPYPELPIDSNVMAWREGLRAIEERMRRQEEEVWNDIKQKLAEAGSQEEFEATIREFNSSGADIGSETTVNRTKIITAPNGEEYHLIAAFKPRFGVEKKDDPVSLR